MPGKKNGKSQNGCIHYWMIETVDSLETCYSKGKCAVCSETRAFANIIHVPGAEH